MLASHQQLLKGLIYMQDKSFQTGLQTFVDSVNKRMDSFMFQTTQEIAEDMKHNIQFTQQLMTCN